MCRKHCPPEQGKNTLSLYDSAATRTIQDPGLFGSVLEGAQQKEYPFAVGKAKFAVPVSAEKQTEPCKCQLTSDAMCLSER